MRGISLGRRSLAGLFAPAYSSHAVRISRGVASAMLKTPLRQSILQTSTNAHTKETVLGHYYYMTFMTLRKKCVRKRTPFDPANAYS